MTSQKVASHIGYAIKNDCLKIANFAVAHEYKVFHTTLTLSVEA
jgi:hypothetical protein